MKRSELLKIRLPALICAAVIAASAAACADTSPSVTGTESSSEVSETITETEAAELKADVPDSDFGGYGFRVLARGQEGAWWNNDITADSLSGDVINDAVYNRNTAVCDKLNITITQDKVMGYDVVSPATKAIMAGDDVYDLIMPQITDGGALAQKGLLTAVQDLKYIDLSKPWYDSRCISELSVYGKNYMFFSDITYRNLEATWIYLFNKSIVEKYSLSDPYTLMGAGTWTMDSMNSMAKAATSDLDGNGVMDKSDNWGLDAHDYVITAAYVGSGEKIAAAADDGSIVLTMDDERVYQVIDKLLELENYWIRYSLTAVNFGTAKPVGFAAGDNYAELVSVFKAGNTLFIGEVAEIMKDMRDSDIDFGVLPTPKLSEEQDKYYTSVNYIAAITCVPKTASDLDRTGIITEVWAAQSHSTVIPAYYEISVKSKYARDIISSDMLDLIFGSRSYDLGVYYGWGKLSGKFCALVYGGSSDFASMYSANKDAAQGEMEEFLAAFKNG